MKYEESRLQIACVRWFRYQYKDIERLFFAVPNGGQRNKVTGKILKDEGVRAGVADLILQIPRKGFSSLSIEMKTEDGRQSVEQKKYQESLEKNGGKYVVCRSFEEFVSIIKDYLA